MTQPELNFKPTLPKIGTVEHKLLRILQTCGSWITQADIRDYFGRTEKGVNSIGRFIRFLREHNYNIEKRHRKDNCWEYKLK